MIKYNAEEIEDIIGNLSKHDMFGKKLTKKAVQTLKDKEECDISELVGYTVQEKTDGEHKNDGQMVEYKFTFVSPVNKKTTVTTEMCLMVGWNFCDTLYTIK